MPVSTTVISGHRAVIHLDGGGGAPTEISCTSVEATIEKSVNQNPYHVFCDNWAYISTGGRQATVNLDVLMSLTAAEASRMISDWIMGTGGTGPGTARTLRIDVPDDSIGSQRFEAEVKIESLSEPFAAGDGGPVRWTVTLPVHGEPTQEIISS